MEEWLEWFDRRMEDRKVLLLLDNFSAHECALESLELKNVRVEFLPPNTTSLCQPCDQGIIYALKGYYRRYFTQWCLDRWDGRQDPLAEVNVLMAIRWVACAWKSDVKGSTLANCFRKSGVLLQGGAETRRTTEAGEENNRADVVEDCQEGAEEVEDNDVAELREELERTMAQLIAQRRVAEVLAVDDFVMPADEDVDDPTKDLTAHIVATIDVVDTESPEDILNEVPPARVSHTTALANAESLLTYAEQQPTSNSDMHVLLSLRRQIQQRQAELRRSQAQQTLDSWVE